MMEKESRADAPPLAFVCRTRRPAGSRVTWRLTTADSGTPTAAASLAGVNVATSNGSMPAMIVELHGERQSAFEAVSVCR
jgi:hypothetical protein